MSFKDFIEAYTGGSLIESPAWRAYDIEGAVTPKRVQEALKSLGYAYAGELGIPTVAASYGIETQSARALLGMWRVFEGIEGGQRLAKPRRALLRPLTGHRS